MAIEQHNIDFLREKFAQMQTKQDFVSLLSEASSILYGVGSKPVLLKSLNYYANQKICKKRYTFFLINKKAGGYRSIHAPVRGLKNILRPLNLILQSVYQPHDAAMGFIPKKSIVNNAQSHIGNHYVYNIDLKDFFSSVEAGRIRSRLNYPPFNLIDGERKDIANMITWLCTHKMEVERLNNSGNFDKAKKNVLPQGAPTSPAITNIICERLDFHLHQLAQKRDIKYTRYADDITFSCMYNAFENDGDFLGKVREIISNQFFNIKETKTRLQRGGYRQEVTGLIVNDKVNVRRRYVKQIRMWLYYCEKYSYEKAQQIFIRDYIADKGHVMKGKPNLINVLDGKLEFLKMIKGNEDPTYITLKKRFDKLNGTASPLNAILDFWENEGIEKAMEIFNQQ